MARDLAIDLGTANTLVYVRGHGVRLNEPTVIAIDQRTRAIVAMGNEAAAMLGRTPDRVIAVRPLRAGAISDFDTTAQLLRSLVQRVGGGRLRRPRVVICVSSALTPVERRAVHEATLQAGAKEAFLLDEPMAAAIGAGIAVKEPFGHLVVDIGGGTTEVACIALGGVVATQSIRVGGFNLDAAIQQYVREEYAIGIGDRTAEQAKCAIGSAFPRLGEPKVELRGREVATGLPKTVIVTAEEIRTTLDEAVQQIVDAIRETLASVEPELANDVVDSGISLSGGGSLLRGLDRRIAQEIGIPVQRAERPMEAVVLGAGVVVEDIDTYLPVLGSG